MASQALEKGLAGVTGWNPYAEAIGALAGMGQSAPSAASGRVSFGGFNMSQNNRPGSPIADGTANGLLMIGLVAATVLIVGTVIATKK